MQDRVNRAMRSRVRVLRKRIVEADLAGTSGNGAALSIDMSADPLPPGSIVLGRSVTIATLFTGAGATSVALTLGYLGQLNAIISALETNNTSATNRALQGTSGTSPIGPELAGLVPKVTLTPDGAHNLAALTAGDLTVELYYSVPDEAAG